jgi:predicted  nucleic acid-binding Zn ribbon protein
MPWPLHQCRDEDTLPKSVKNDWEAAELLARYFFEQCQDCVLVSEFATAVS